MTQTKRRNGGTRDHSSIAGLGCFFRPLGFLDLCGLLAKCHTQANSEQTSVKSANSYTFVTDWHAMSPIWAHMSPSQNQSKSVRVTVRNSWQSHQDKSLNKSLNKSLICLLFLPWQDVRPPVLSRVESRPRVLLSVCQMICSSLVMLRRYNNLWNGMNYV